MIVNDNGKEASKREDQITHTHIQISTGKAFLLCICGHEKQPRASKREDLIIHI